MKKLFKLGIFWIFSICCLQFSWSQNKINTAEKKEIVSMSLTISRANIESGVIGNVFQGYTDYIVKVSKELSLQDFKLESKSFSVFNDKDKDNLQATFDIAFSFVYDKKKINAFCKALHFNKAEQWALNSHMYKEY